MAVVAGTSPLTARRRLGAELRVLRDQAGLSSEEVGVHLNCHNSKITRLETAKRACTQRDFESLMDLYGVDGEKRDELAELARRGRQRIPPWWHAYADVVTVSYGEFLAYEAESVHTREYQGIVVPAYFQTPDYARAVTEVGYEALGPEQVDNLTELRLRRQELVRGPDPIRYECLIAEAALRFHVGGVGVMRAQLRHIREVAALPNITFRALPFSAGAQAIVLGPFHLMSADENTNSDVAFLEGASGVMFREDALVLQRLNRLFRTLSAAALSEDESLELVERVEKEL